MLIDTTDLKNFWVAIPEIHICISYNTAISPVAIYPTEMYTYVHQNPYKNVHRRSTGTTPKPDKILQLENKTTAT